ncbi:phage tail tape measure protein [Arthrobacter sp. KNU40]|uniref:phage tail tape measure protein n=1 Tax=Arthrobacter sp. KNU40 TaxID=3447965 RepID=UPI003F60D404
MANKINIVITAEEKARGPIRGVADEMDSASSKANKFRDSLLSTAKVAALATGAAGVLAAKFAVTSAADYEQSLNIFKSVSSATSDQMLMVATTARALGKDISLPGVSAKDAALAMVELAKAGLSVNDTMAASKGVLSLAKAGQMDTAAAAEVAANALNSFGLAGGEAGRVADLLAAAANASSADVKDMAYSLQMSSASAAAVKVPIEDLTTMIAEMANNGIKGSDAGTSLKTMFMNLIPTTDNARAAMKQLNLDFYDAKGNFVGVREAIRQLEDGTKNLTDEQKALAIQTIFGTDSSRAANILIKEGVAGYDKMSASVNKQGAAVELAAAQNAGFKGAVDALKSSLETVAIDVGTKMLPTLTSLATTLGSKVEPAFETLLNVGRQVRDFLKPAFEGLGDAVKNALIPALKDVAKSDIVKYIGGALVVAVYAAIRVIEGAIRFVSSLASQLSSATSIVVAATTAIVAYNLIMGGAALKTAAMTTAQLALNAAMRLNPFVLAASAAVGIVAAYVQVVSTSDRTTIATDALRAAQERLTATTNAAKDAQDRLSGAYLTQEGAALAVERAQRTYNDAVSTYGANSLEAREAAFNLKRANDDLARANQEVTDRTNDAKKAEQDKKDAAAEVVKANDAVKESAYRAAGGYALLADNIRKAADEDKKTGVNAGFGGKNQTNALFNVPRHALGTTYAPGGPTILNEHGPEIVNLPRGSQVTPAYRTRNELTNRGNSPVFNVTVNNYTETDYKKMLSDFGFALRLAS